MNTYALIVAGLSESTEECKVIFHSSLILRIYISW